MRPHSSAVPHSFFWLSTLALALGACNCDETLLVPVQPGTCESADYSCPDPALEYRLGACVSARCQGDEQCCPGHKCNLALGACVYQVPTCRDDSDCTEILGQTCLADFRGEQRCGFATLSGANAPRGSQVCSTNADCASGRTCFGNRCIVQVPCDGGCEPGEVCDVDSNVCAPLANCEVNCAQGQMLVLKDPDSMSGPQCCLPECACATLPPIAPGRYGWYAAIATGPQTVAVSAFDIVYGDLVVAQYDNEANLVDLAYVDGFPNNGEISGNPGGPRGGRVEPGPVVGEHTSIVVDDSGAIHVAYYDREEGRLKYARGLGGSWNVSVVDEADHVGRYTSIAIGNDGNPRIAYMMVEGTVAPDPVPQTGLKLATARTNLPSAASDWDVQLVDSAPIPPRPCGGTCPTGQACIDFGSGESCQQTTSGCAMCESGEVCVLDANAAPVCEVKLDTPPLDDLIPGTGLFASLAIDNDGVAHIAYYDRLNSNLRLATALVGGGFDLRTIDGDDPMAPTDVGQHASLAVSDSGTLGVAYFDATAEDLVYYDLTANTREVVDDGISPPDLRLVGADASLIFAPDGEPVIAYQDPTLIDLLIARRSGSPALWNIDTLRGAPPPGQDKGSASGFYVAQAQRDASTFICSVDVTFDVESNLVLDLIVLRQSL